MWLLKQGGCWYIIDLYALKFVGYVCILYVSLICSQWQGHNIAGKDHRVHCSININTETGRLSARRPNLQVLQTCKTSLAVGLLEIF